MAVDDAPNGGVGDEGRMRFDDDRRSFVPDDILYADIKGPFYIGNSRSWVNARKQLAITDGEVLAQDYEGALLLPPVKRMDIEVRDGVFSGGVCAADGTYVAGHLRSLSNPQASLSCYGSYDVEEDAIEYRDEDVIFGGFLFNHFGHQLTESTARLWYAVAHPQDARKLVFLYVPAGSLVVGDFDGILKLAGIDPARVEVVERPTRFRRVTVPDQALFLHSGADARGLIVFQAIRARAAGPSYPKVYLSKGKFARQDYINERFLEEFHRARGFEVVYPETLAFEEQVAIVANADEVATTIGTMSHLFLFAKPEARLAIYLRSTALLPAQLLVDKLAGHQPAYVYVARNLLPTRHMTGAHLFGPTRYFRKYLMDAGIPFTEEELGGYDPTGRDVLDCLHRYDVAFRNKNIQGEAAAWDMSEVFAALHESLLDIPSSKKDYAGASLAKRLDAAPADVEGEEEPPTFKLSWCGYDGGWMEPHFKSDFLKECPECRIALTRPRRMEVADVTQQVLKVEDDVAFVRIDLGGFLDVISVPPSCVRWDVYVVAPGVFQPLECETGTRHFTSLTDFFAYRDGRLLIPHVSDQGTVCFWYVGEKRLNFSTELAHSRADRALVGDLLMQIILAGRWDAVPLLYWDFQKGRIAAVPRGGKSVEYRKVRYPVGQLAYLQAELALPAWYRVARWLVRAARKVRRGVAKRVKGGGA